MQLGPEVAPFNFDGNTADQSKVQLLLQQLKAGGADEGQAAAAIANMTPKQQADLNSSSQSASSTQPKSLEELLGGIDHNLVQSLLNGVSGAGTGTGVVSALPSSAEHPHQVAVASSAPGHPAWGAPGPDSAHGWGQHQPAQAGYGDYSNGHGHPNQWGANDPSGYGSNQPPSWGGGGYGGPMGAPGGGTSSLPTPLGIPTEPFRDRPPSGPNHRGGGRHGLKTCRFYKTEAGCRRGDQCIFAHID